MFSVVNVFKKQYLYYSASVTEMMFQYKCAYKIISVTFASSPSRLHHLRHACIISVTITIWPRLTLQIVHAQWDGMGNVLSCNIYLWKKERNFNIKCVLVTIISLPRKHGKNEISLLQNIIRGLLRNGTFKFLEISYQCLKWYMFYIDAIYKWYLKRFNNFLRVFTWA